MNQQNIIVGTIKMTEENFKYENPDDDWEAVLTKEEAEEVKHFRVERGCTWRAVASRFAELHPDQEVCAGNQIEGMMLCKAARKILGEREKEDGWN